MDLASAIESRNSILSSAGKTALNIQYPKEFELYIIGLELCDEYFNTLKYFTFPINPSSMEESKPQITNVKKTMEGVITLKNNTFIPTEISITGTFGRNFKILLGDTYEDFIHSFTASKIDEDQFATNYLTFSSTTNGLKKVFSERIKTGYGCLKVLESIIDESKLIGSNGKLRHLIFHNPALGNSYIVTPGTLKMFQNEANNMIWSYTLPLKAVAPLESTFSAQKNKQINKQLAVTGFIQERVSGLLNATSRIVRGQL